MAEHEPTGSDGDLTSQELEALMDSFARRIDELQPDQKDGRTRCWREPRLQVGEGAALRNEDPGRRCVHGAASPARGRVILRRFG